MPDTAHIGYGSAIRSLGDGTFVTTWLEGSSAVRLGHVDAASGRGVVVKGVRGLLRDVLCDRSADRAWLLCTHGVHEVSLAPLRIIRTLTRGLGTYNLSLHRLGPDIVGVGKRYGRALHLVSLSRMEVIGRLITPLPDLVLDTATGPLLLSFSARQARRFDRDLKPVGRRRPLPLGATPVATGRGITFLPGTLRPPRVSPAMPDGFDVDRFSDVVADGRIAAVDVATLTMVGDPVATPARALHAVDDAGRLLGSDRKPGAGGRRVMVLDGHDHRVLVTAELPAPVGDVTVVAAQSVIIGHNTPARVSTFASLVTWA